MKFKSINFIKILLIIILINGCSSKNVGGNIARKKPVAKVNDQIIEQVYYKKSLSVAKYIYELEYGKKIWDKKIDGRKYIEYLKENMLEKLIKTEVIKQYVDKNSSFKIDNKEVNELLDVNKKYLKKDTKKTKYYKENEIDDEFLKKNIINSLYKDEFKNLVKKDLEKNINFLNEKNKEIVVTVDVSQILVKTEEKANEIYKKLKEGEEFVKLAKEESIDLSSADKGGSLGYVDHGQRTPIFEKVAFNSEVGKINKPIKTSFGYHIILVNDRKTINDLIVDGAKDKTINKYREYIINQVLQEKLSDKTNKLVEDANIEKFIKFSKK